MELTDYGDNMEKEEFKKYLDLALQEKEIGMTEKQKGMLLIHFLLLEKWREVHNLTTIRGVKKIVFLHYLDCILGLAFLTPPREVYDFGSGAGFPGLIAAIFWPERKLILVESSRKKCSFLREAFRQMGLTNVEVRQSRVEQLKEVSFAFSRATFSLSTLSLASKALESGGKIALWVTEGDKKLEHCKNLNLVKEAEFLYEWEGIKPRRIVLLKKV